MTDAANAPYVWYVVQYNQRELGQVEDWGRRYHIKMWESPEAGNTVATEDLRTVWDHPFIGMRGRGFKWFYQRNGFRTVKAYIRHPATESKEGWLYSIARGGGD